MHVASTNSEENVMSIAKWGLGLFPVVVALLLTGFVPNDEKVVKPIDERLHLVRINVESVQALQAEFLAINYTWPPQAQVPRIELNLFPSDLDTIVDVKQKKALFFSALLPIVLAENELIAVLREQTITLLTRGYGQLADTEQTWLRNMAQRYKVKGDMAEGQVQQALLTRLDVVPAALVLAQAANESAWGTSRFARQGNNLFGQWTYRESEGIVPLGRPEGETYAVRAFKSVDASVRAYLRNLNTNRAYRELRRLRREMRDQNQPLDAHQLAHGLLAYSARGEEYIAEIQSMMRTNRLISLLDGVRLQQGG